MLLDVLAHYDADVLTSKFARVPSSCLDHYQHRTTAAPLHMFSAAKAPTMAVYARALEEIDHHGDTQYGCVCSATAVALRAAVAHTFGLNRYRRS